MSDAPPAQLGSLTATCEICGAVIDTPPQSTDIREIDGKMCLVIEMDSADLELHMLNHGAA